MHQIYSCDFCSKFGSKEEIKEHENNCIYNPKNKSCFSCKYGVMMNNYWGSKDIYCNLEKTDDELHSILTSCGGFNLNSFGKQDSKDYCRLDCDRWEKGKMQTMEIRGV